jgi:hypothetical protein
MARGAVLRAAERFALAVSLGRESATDDEAVLGWELQRADALVASGQLIEAHAIAMKVADAARRGGHVELFADAAVRLTGPMIPTGSARDAAEDHLVAALEWLPDHNTLRAVHVAEALARSMIGQEDESVERRAAGIRPVLRRAADHPTTPREQATALLGLRSLAWAEHRAPIDRVRLSSGAIEAAQRAVDPALLLATHRVAAADLFEATDPTLGRSLESYWAAAEDCGAGFHGWLSSRVSAAWAHARGDTTEHHRLLDRARPLADGTDARVVQRADIETVLADHLQRGALAELAPFTAFADDLDDEMAVMAELGFRAIRVAAGENADAEELAAQFALAPRGPWRAGAAAFVALALRGIDGDGQKHLARAVIDVLQPATRAMVLLDGGIACLGPADAYLAMCNRFVGDEPAVEYHRERALAVAGEFAPAWRSWAKGEAV